MTSQVFKSMSSLVYNLTANANYVVVGNSTNNSSQINSTEARQISSTEALYTSTNHFQNILNVAASFGSERSQSMTVFSSSYDWDVYGGDSSVVDFLNPNNSAQAFQDWKGTVPFNPIPVQWKMLQISELFDDNYVKSQLRLAIDLFLSMDTSEIITLNRSPDANFDPFANVKKREGKK